MTPVRDGVCLLCGTGICDRTGKHLTTQAKPCYGTGPATVTVHEHGYVGDEPVLGVGRYRDGSLVLVAWRTPPWAPHLPGPITYRTRGREPGWYVVWAMPEPLRAFISTEPVGSIGKASNRRVEIVDYPTVVPARTLTIARGLNAPNWVHY